MTLRYVTAGAKPQRWDLPALFIKIKIKVYLIIDKELSSKRLSFQSALSRIQSHIFILVLRSYSIKFDALKMTSFHNLHSDFCSFSPSTLCLLKLLSDCLGIHGGSETKWYDRCETGVVCWPASGSHLVAPEAW